MIGIYGVLVNKSASGHELNCNFGISRIVSRNFSHLLASSIHKPMLHAGTPDGSVPDLPRRASFRTQILPITPSS